MMTNLRRFHLKLNQVTDPMKTHTSTSASHSPLSPELAKMRLKKSGMLRVALIASFALGAILASSGASAQQAAPVAQTVIVADFNHDGIPDTLVESSVTPTATIAFGSVPYGTFATSAKAVTFPSACTSFNSDSLVVGDFNNDGFADIAFFCGGTSGVDLGNGDGTFAASKSLAGAIGSKVVAGDFNKDGNLDLVVLGLTFGPNTTTLGTLQFFAGNGDGTFLTGVNTVLDQFNYTAPAVADINGDGYPDILLLSIPDGGIPSVNIFGHNQDGTFGSISQGVATPNTLANVSNTASTILVGNFFGLQTVDLAVSGTGANAEFSIFQNTSSGTTYTLNDPVTIPFANLTGAQVGKFTGSGFTDIAASNGTSIAVLVNDGKGNLSASYPSLTLASTASLFAVADANNDSYADLYTALLPQTGALQLGVNLTSGSATATSQPFSLNTGTQAVSATWSGNVNFTGSTPTGSQIVIGVPSVTTLASSKNPSLVGDSVTFSVHVAAGATSGSTPIPTGSVVIADGATMLTSGQIDEAGNLSYTTSALTQATHAITATYAGNALYALSSASVSQVVNHAPAVASNITWATPAAIPYGTLLSTVQLNAVAMDANGAGIPGIFVYTPAAGALLNIGTQTLSAKFTPDDLLSFQVATKTVNIVVTGVTVGSFTPSSAALGSGATTITVTGAGFVSNSVAQVNGTAIPTILVNPTKLTAVIPASYFTNVGSLAITVADPSIGVTSAPVTFTVTAPTAVAVLTAPPTTDPGTQPTIDFTISQPYPVDITATLTLGFAPSTTPAVDDPSIQFSGGGRTLTFVVPANTVAVPTITLQAGTVAGTITVPITLTAGGANVTPTTLLPAVIVVPPIAPSISGVALTRTGNQLTVVVHGFSNTREMVNAKFHFTAAAGASLGTTDLTIPADVIFNTNWFQTTPSDQYGSTFTYTQVFNTSDVATNIGSIDVTLTNTVGASVVKTSQ